MKLIGYWIRSLCDDDFLPPQELIGDYDASTRNAIADYLDCGYQFAAYRGVSWCRFFCDHPMGNRELTDGTWVWPEGLSHYVRDHSVRLLDSFVARACLPFRTAMQGENDLPIETPDKSFWIAWCAANRSNSLKSQFQTARDNANAEASQIKAETIAEYEQTEGLSDTICQSSGCDNLALLGRALCASCILSPEWSWRLSGPYLKLRPAMDA